MKPLASLVILLLAATAATGRPSLVGGGLSTGSPTAGSPHPAVVRVIVPDGRVTSFGSGALVAVGENLGLVVTNWHVVQDAQGQIVVVFPDGFRSAATLLSTDRDWDLAALAIWRPHVEPIPLATRPPRPGEPLTIAGYGKGRYRAITGRCIQYVAPGRNHPSEMVELSAGAREGDSGGPILNSRGELAGVLFGTAWGRTAGSYCGRVRWFLTSAARDFQRLDASSTMIARKPRPRTAPVARQPETGPATIARQPQPSSEPIGEPWRPDPTEPNDQPPASRLPVVAIRAIPSLPRESSGAERPATSSPNNWTGSGPQPAAAGEVAPPQAAEPLRWEDIAGSTRSEQLKTILAAVGLLAIFFHGLKLVGKAQAS